MLVKWNHRTVFIHDRQCEPTTYAINGTLTGMVDFRHDTRYCTPPCHLSALCSERQRLVNRHHQFTSYTQYIGCTCCKLLHCRPIRNSFSRLLRSPTDAPEGEISVLIPRWRRDCGHHTLIARRRCSCCI